MAPESIGTATVYISLAWIGSKILNVNFKLTLRNFGYILLPFGYMAMIRDITITYFFKGSFIPVKFPGIIAAYPFIDIVLMLIGVAWSIYMAKRISEVTLRQGDQAPNTKGVFYNVLLQSFMLVALTFYWISMVSAEYITSLSGFGISYMAPFILSSVLIGSFIIVVNVINIRIHGVAN